MLFWHSCPDGQSEESQQVCSCGTFFERDTFPLQPPSGIPVETVRKNRLASTRTADCFTLLPPAPGLGIFFAWCSYQDHMKPTDFRILSQGVYLVTTELRGVTCVVRYRATHEVCAIVGTEFPESDGQVGLFLDSLVRVQDRTARVGLFSSVRWENRTCGLPPLPQPFGQRSGLNA